MLITNFCHTCVKRFNAWKQLMIHKKENHSTSLKNCHYFLNGNCVFSEEDCCFRHNEPEQTLPTLKEFKWSFCGIKKYLIICIKNPPKSNCFFYQPAIRQKLNTFVNYFLYLLYHHSQLPYGHCDHLPDQILSHPVLKPLTATSKVYISPPNLSLFVWNDLNILSTDIRTSIVIIRFIKESFINLHLGLM